MIRLRLLLLLAVLAMTAAARAADDVPATPAKFSDYFRYNNSVTPLPKVKPDTLGESTAQFMGFTTNDPQFVEAFPEYQPAAPPPAPDATRLVETIWYTRLDYFVWYERINGAPFMKETGLLPAIGYQHRTGPQRFRAELFGNKVHYGAEITFQDGMTFDMSSHTDYLGLRGEYEFLFEPDWWPQHSVFVGFGSRFWIRNLVDDQLDANHFVFGYQETWWTFYPYLGLEKRRTLKDAAELYSRARVGLVAFTYEHATIDDLILFPRQGLTAQVECGVRSQRLFLAAHFEAMQWGQSGEVRFAVQPRSQMYLVGLKTGFSF